MSHPLDEEFKNLEQKVWLDISIARASFEIVSAFLKPLQEESSQHLRKRDFPFIHAISWACFESIISSLGRLFNDAPRSTEATLKKLVDQVRTELLSGKTINRHSNFSKTCAQSLQDRNSSRLMKRKLKMLWGKIENLRNKVVSHSDLTFPEAQLPRLMPDVTELIDFAEETHRICQSALWDSSQAGPYLDGRFKKIARNWVDVLKT